MSHPFDCPRRGEMLLFGASREQRAHFIEACLHPDVHPADDDENPTTPRDRWRDPDRRHPYRSCSYCGGIHPKDLFAAIDAGVAELGPTDKGYKVYVRLPDPTAGERWIAGTSNAEPRGDWVKVGRKERRELKREGRWGDHIESVLWGERSATVQAKLYTPHLDREHATKLHQLLIDGNVRVGYPGWFYNGLWLPTMSTPEAAPAPDGS